MKVILDTNVVVSAILRGRKPADVIRYVAEHPDIEWLVSREILDEYQKVIHRPKFGLSEEMVQQWLDLIDELTVLVVVSQQVDFPRDPKDAKFLACALSAEVDYLVTGDHDFEEAKKFGTTTIISVSQFVALIING
ncbi:MAG: putative toxin-antitoxin system toxin component, PIN family [Planctomycetes bacterium]|nr:putative toxin-antitoxin system toxin component, PIN family [Planctomycetota bacterium]